MVLAKFQTPCHRLPFPTSKQPSPSSQNLATTQKCLHSSLQLHLPLPPTFLHRLPTLPLHLPSVAPLPHTTLPLPRTLRLHLPTAQPLLHTLRHHPRIHLPLPRTTLLLLHTLRHHPRTTLPLLHTLLHLQRHTTWAQAHGASSRRHASVKYLQYGTGWRSTLYASDIDPQPPNQCQENENAPHSRLKSNNSRPKTRNSKPKTRNSNPKTRNSSSN